MVARHDVAVIEEISAPRVERYLDAHPETGFVIVPYVWNAHVLQELTGRGAKFIVDTLDCMSARTKSFERVGLKCSKPYAPSEESAQLRQFDYVMAITEEDASRFREMGVENVFTVPYAFSIPPQKPKLGFIGGKSQHNIEAVKWFCDKVFRNRFEASFDLYICGHVAETELRELYGDAGSVYFYSVIHKIEDFYRMVDITLNPLQCGSGMSTKALESVVFGKPIITTSIGLAGLGAWRHAMMVADSVPEWIALLRSIEERWESLLGQFRTGIDSMVGAIEPEVIYRPLDQVLTQGNGEGGRLLT